MRALIGHLALDGADGPIEGELPNEEAIIETLQGDLAREGKNRHGDRQIEPRSGLTDIPGRKAHRKRAPRNHETTRTQRASDSAARVHDGGIRHATMVIPGMVPDDEISTVTSNASTPRIQAA